MCLISVERSKKKKSTSKSVGANFDHTTDKPDDWWSIFHFIWDSVEYCQRPSQIRCHLRFAITQNSFAKYFCCCYSRTFAVISNVRKTIVVLSDYSNMSSIPGGGGVDI